MLLTGCCFLFSLGIERIFSLSLLAYCENQRILFDLDVWLSFSLSNYLIPRDDKCAVYFHEPLPFSLSGLAQGEYDKNNITSMIFHSLSSVRTDLAFFLSHFVFSDRMHMAHKKERTPFKLCAKIVSVSFHFLWMES